MGSSWKDKRASETLIVFGVVGDLCQIIFENWFSWYLKKYD